MKKTLVLSIIILLFGCSKDDITGPLEIENSIMTDTRDGQVYKIVRIGEQWWNQSCEVSNFLIQDFEKLETFMDTRKQQKKHSL